MEAAPRKRCSFVSARRSPPLVLIATAWIRRDMENRRNLAPAPTSDTISGRPRGHLERWTSSSAIRWVVDLALGACVKRDFAPSFLLGSATRPSWASTGRRCSWQVYLTSFFDPPSYEQ